MREFISNILPLVHIFTGSKGRKKSCNFAEMNSYVMALCCFAIYCLLREMWNNKNGTKILFRTKIITKKSFYTKLKFHIQFIFFRIKYSLKILPLYGIFVNNGIKGIAFFVNKYWYWWIFFWKIFSMKEFSVQLFCHFRVFWNE